MGNPTHTPKIPLRYTPLKNGCSYAARIGVFHMVDSSLPAERRNKVELHSGSVLGDYRLKELLDTGEAGQVFQARNITTGVQYRLCILAVPAQLDAEARLLYLGYFQKQANQVAALQHAHILPLHSYGTYQGAPYLAYQHYPMVSLSKHLAQHGALDAQRAGFYLDQIAAALECGQQHGILHRNLSTECIFVKQDGDLVVTDFGVLHILEYEGNHAPAANYES